MAELNLGFVAGLVFDGASYAKLPRSMVSMGAVYKQSVERMTLYTKFGIEVKSICYPVTYSDDGGVFGIVFQWDASDIGAVMDAAMSDRLEYSITAWRQVGDLRVPSKTRSTLKLRPNAGGMGLPKSGLAWIGKSAAAIEKAAKQIKVQSPAGLGKARTTELYYLVDVVDVPAYATARL